MNQYWAAGLLGFYLLSCIACGVLGIKYESAKCKSADEKHDLAQAQNTVAAEAKVVSVVQTQGTITREASNEYAKSSAAVNSAYAVSVQQPAHSTVNGVPAVCRTPGRAKTPRVSKVYKLTPQQCDMEEAKFNALWNWSNRQAQAGGSRW